MLSIIVGAADDCYGDALWNHFETNDAAAISYGDIFLEANAAAAIFEPLAASPD